MANAAGDNEFSYDYAGRRISTWPVATNSAIEGRIYWGGQQIAYHSNYGLTYFEHQDLEGTDRVRTDPWGATAATYTNLSFGDGGTQTVGGTTVNQDNNSFTSLELDPETETNHAQFRQYSPEQGSWMSPDPYAGSYDMNNPQSFNRYSYALNNPLTFTDPSGQDGGGIACVAGPIACIGGLVAGGIIDWILAEDIFSGGPSFHGSLQPRPGVSDPGSFGESLGIPTSIPQGNWGIGLALNLPQEACEFGACGDISNSFTNAATAPLGWCAEHPTICTVGADAAAFARAVPVVLASAMLLNMQGDNKPKPSEAECRVIVQNAKNACTNKYPFANAPGNQLGAWRACVRQIVEPTGCDF